MAKKSRGFATAERGPALHFSIGPALNILLSKVSVACNFEISRTCCRSRLPMESAQHGSLVAALKVISVDPGAQFDNTYTVNKYNNPHVITRVTNYVIGRSLNSIVLSL